ncbi:efflux RND transporter periplasmic adaptor subunit [Paracidovorax wautersii]|uniref:Membrane fusion protein (Multidrug efflux system) n=1 Tax=Paracidovorax wautersii TaxID=1177982 RepID=A0ABU1IFA1_9BURK|nr:efflux RND transporter periplasmic adaptor subunit [Paracidovorax wautersii]MDR6215895.1 membrane fusion protein (multidrug efflux system) [Paracidovorax wautersii]
MNPTRCDRLPLNRPALTPSCPTTVPPGRSRTGLRLAAAALLALAAAACSDKSAQQPAPRAPATVGMVTLQPERQTVTTELPGRTSAFLTAEIRPQVGGIVQKRLFTEGADVKAEQVLYQIDPASFQVALASAEAALEKARATLGTTETNARRNAELVKIDAISRQVFDESQAAAVQARSDVAVARANLDTARINLGYTAIKAPISGRSSTSTVTPGALVTANQTTALTTITQNDPLYVDVTQSSTEVLRLKNEMARGRFQRVGNAEARITIKLEDGSDYAHPGRLQFSGVSVNPTTGAITLRAIVPNPDGLLMPGMYVRAVLQAGVNEQTLLVPQQSVTRDAAGNPSVLLVTADGNKLERRRITTGAAVGSRWEVVSGLAAGDRVLVDGAQRARAGDTVNPVPWQPAPNKAANGSAAPSGAPAAAASVPASAPASAAR